MIKVQLSGREYKIDDQMRLQVEQKLGNLDRYFDPSKPPVGLNVEIFQDPSGREGNRFRVRAVLAVSGPDLIAEATAAKPDKAIDLAAEKLRHQIQKYKDKGQTKSRRYRRLNPKAWFGRDARETTTDSDTNQDGSDK